MTNTPFAWPLSTDFKFEIWLHHLIFKKKQHISMSSMSYGRRHLTKHPVILTWLVLRHSDVTGTFKYNFFGWRTGWRWPQWLLGHPCGHRSVTSRAEAVQSTKLRSQLISLIWLADFLRDELTWQNRSQGALPIPKANIIWPIGAGEERKASKNVIARLAITTTYQLY